MVELLNKVTGGLSVLSGLICIGVFIYTQLIFQKPLPQDSVVYQEFLEEAKRNLVSETIKIPKLIINLPSPHSRLRFLQVQGEITPTKGKYVELLKSDHGQAVIQDTLITLASQTEPDELASVTGKLFLSAELKKTMNSHLGKMAVGKIYFTHFVVQ